MPKIRSSVIPVAVPIGLLVVSFFVVAAPNGMIALAQEGPPQSQEQKQAREALNKGVQDFLSQSGAGSSR